MKETRTGSSGERIPHPKPVEKIELSDKHWRLRLALTVVFLAVGAAFLAYSAASLFSKDPGWCEIEADASKYSCGDDFVFQYCLGQGDMSATAECKALTACYSEAAEYAFQMFTNDVEYDGVCNLYYINQHPNEILEVEDVLYQAFSLIQQSGDRNLYLAPVYAQYNGLFLCTEEYQAEEYISGLNPDLAAYYNTIAAFANDTQEVDLELMGENRIRLRVSQEYLRFAQENEIDNFLDFGWMKNAFIADYLADVLIENGFYNGCLSSYDGFTRCLGPQDQTYSFSLFDRQGTDIHLPARMQYSAPESIVFLRNYPLTGQDEWHYYTFASGEIATIFLDPVECVSKSATDNLVSYSAQMGCGEILLQIVPLFVADSFRPEGVNALVEEGVHSVWYEGETLKYNDPALSLELLPDSSSRYSISLEK